MISFNVWNQLTKPRVTLLILATVMPGIYLGSTETPSYILVTFTLFGTYLMSSASFILNQYIEREKDALMYRTKMRPIPGGKISPNNALALGITVTILAFALLTYTVNLLTAICAFGALVAYVWLYTIVLKPRTEQNIVIGGVSGCVGPLIGYAAVSNSLPLPAWVMFTMIFLWTPAHFWALAIFLKDDYARAEIPMLPVVKGIKQTTISIFIYTILYSISCFAFYFSHDGMGVFFLTSTAILTIAMVSLSIQLIRSQSTILAKKFFYFSLLHMFVMTVVIIVDARMIA
ncbi:heme o synthase [Leptospira sp. GIMC2001]|uniref:heme o synthase n=1 Tax=Leptospira sp. GIMC2001 TaxID=1513297 RepID=UPI00234A0B42|nr:heme o synthase [Leptospira sp. GIMC2001]WCL48502.1 heme o synthase [Leptospira sp. GIMC2001]